MVDIKNLLDMASKNCTEQKEKASKAKKFAVGVAVIGAAGALTCIIMTTRKVIEMRGKCKSKALNSVEKAMNTVQDKAEAINIAAEKAAKTATSAINDIDKKTDDLNVDIKGGYHNVKNDINKTAENISNDLKKADK